jgi:hypothetical protein
MTSATRGQIIPLFLTVVAFFGLSLALYAFIHILNLFPTQTKIITQIRPVDVLVGMTIYLKTSIDFAIFIGNLMRKNTGLKKRIAIEFGTAAGNALGTLSILAVWFFLKGAPVALLVMIVIASLVLFRMAQESFEEFLHKGTFLQFHKSVSFLNQQVKIINKVSKPFINFIIPNLSLISVKKMSFFPLLFFSFTIPFILGLDDFAGYVPLFSIVNVFSFSIGVFLGHMLLNIGLFIMPKKTTSLVENPAILLLGGLAFVGIASWGFYEAFKILLSLLGF